MKERAPGAQPRGLSGRCGVSAASDSRDVRGLLAALARNEIELDAVSVRQGPESIASDGRVVDEYVLTHRRLDEPVALRFVEPLHAAMLTPFRGDGRRRQVLRANSNADAST